MQREKVRLSYARFNAARVFALIAFFCTLLIAIVILGESLTPGKESAAQSGNIAEDIKDVVDVNDNDTYIATQSIVLLKTSSANYIGSEVTPSVTFLPSGAQDVEVEFSSSNEGIAVVTEEGKIRFLSMGTAKITCRLKSDPSISASAYFTCLGPNPKNVTKLVLRNDPVVKVGSSEYFNLYDQEGNAIALAALSVKISDPDLLSFANETFSGMRMGMTDVTFSTKGVPSPVTLTVKFEVRENPDFVMPQQFVYDEQITVEKGKTYTISNFVHGVLPKGSALTAQTYRRALVNPEDSVVIQDNNDWTRTFTVKNTGEAEIRLTSSYNPDCVGVIKVVAVEPVPTKLTIIGKNRVCKDDENTLEVFADETYVSDVTWSVVEGDAELLGGGAYKAKKLGKLVLRATSNSDPTVYADMSITVSLFSSFGSMVRKLFGHFGLFMLLGIGLTVSLFMLIKPRWVFAILAPVFGFLTALLSEVFQMPIFTTGRYAAWSDVLIDFSGAMTGFIVATILIFLYILCRKPSKSYRSLKASFGFLTFKTAFKQYIDLDMFYRIKNKPSAPLPQPAKEATAAMTMEPATDMITEENSPEVPSSPPTAPKDEA